MNGSLSQDGVGKPPLDPSILDDLHVAIVSGSPAWAERCCQALVGAGAAVRLCSAEIDLFSALGSESFDLVLLADDGDVPAGVVLRSLREEPLTADIPAL